MSDTHRIGVIGVGYAVPIGVRGNDDPIFDWLKQHAPAGEDLFAGYDERRILGPNETLMDIMVPAAHRALDDARIGRAAVDVLLGDASVSDFIMPNGLAQLHRELDLPSSAWIIPLNNEYSNFNAGLLLADALIRAGRAGTALVVCGGNWSRRVNYQTPPAISAGDGAGAAVLGRTTDRARFTLVDAIVETQSDDYGAMTMQPDPIPPVPPATATAYTAPYFHLTAAGRQIFADFGERHPPAVVGRLLARHGLTGADIALIGHQASSVLLDAWRAAIGPAQLLDTLATFGNMTLASIPVNLAYFHDRIAHDHLVLLGLGAEVHVSALLLRRNG
jgi:3-oxoacyl-[acyl-carrier-protein] synthase-3